MEQWAENRCRSYCPSLASFQYSNTPVPMVWSNAYIELRIEASAQQVWLQYGNEYEGQDEA